jgi:hypothetical protein
MKNDVKSGLCVVVSKISIMGLFIIFVGLGQAIIDSPLQLTVNSSAWELDNGWSITEDDLIGKDQGRAVYAEFCQMPSVTFEFNLKSLRGGLEADINANGSSFYAIGLTNNGNGTLSSYLIRQAEQLSSSEAISENVSGLSVPYNSTQTYQVKIAATKGRIRVYLSEMNLPSVDAVKLIDYYDPNPLPPGLTAFQILPDSEARLNRVNIICSSPSSENAKSPNLGVGYFKRPT